MLCSGGSSSHSPRIELKKNFFDSKILLTQICQKRESQVLLSKKELNELPDDSLY